MIIVTVFRTHAAAVVTEVLTAGRVGMEAKFHFSSEWDGLGKTAVFEAGGVTRDVIVDPDGILVPHECMIAGADLRVGVYGYDESGEIVIPTIYALVGQVQRGADPSGDESYPPTPDVGEQAVAAASKALEAAAEAQEVAADIQRRADAGEFDGAQGEKGDKGDKGDPGTGAVELDPTLTQSGKAADAKAVGDALDELEAKIGEVGSEGITEETDPTVPAWAKAATKPTYTAAEVGAMAADAPVVKTVNGAAPDGSGNVVVPSGVDGVSATHKWNGTVLTITSASGTSSADLKGDTGAKGDKGDPGEPGASGAPGADGKTPERGVDYWTETDKAEIVAEVLAALPNAEGASF